VKSKWLNRLVEYGSYGDTPIVFIAPHEGGDLIELDVDETKEIVEISERGTGHLVKLAAKQIGATFIINQVSRIQADFARNPDLLGKGETFKYFLKEKRREFKCHTDIKYLKLLKRFHNLIEKRNPSFIIDFHRMSSEEIDIRLGFGVNRKYIGGTKNAFDFRKKIFDKSDFNDLNVMISKKVLAGESEFILNKHHKGRHVALVEFSSQRGFDLEKGYISERYETFVKKLAEVSTEF